MISFDASGEEEHDAVKMNVMPLLSQKLLPKHFVKAAILEFLLSGA